MAMTEEEKAEIASTYAIGAVAQSYVIYSIINAMCEKGLVDQNRIIAWAETFASQFDQSPGYKENADIAERLKQFAATLRLMTTPPAGSGRA